jgi:hypothetical protein
MVRVIEDLVPVVFGKTDGELVGVECGAGGHGEDLAGVGIHGDDGADFAFEGFLGGHLEVEVDGELEVFAGGGEFLSEVAEFFAVAIDDNVTAAIGAAEEGVVGGLDAGAADDIAGRIEGVALIGGEHLLRDLTDVADEVGGEAVAGVESALLVECLEFGELIAVGSDEGLLVGSDVLLERDGLVFGGYLKAADCGLDLLDGDVEACGDERQVGVEIFDLFSEQVTGDGRVVVDEEAAIPVEELAAGGKDGDFTDPVGFGERAEAFGVEHLKAPKAGEEDGEDKCHEILCGVEFADGQLLGLAEGASGLGFGMGMVDLLHAYLSLRPVVRTWLSHRWVSGLFVKG